MEHTWIPSEFASKKFGLLILNTEIEDTVKVTGLWQAASFRILVDGGANRFLDQILHQKPDLTPPDLITGDLDSIRPEVRLFFAENVPVVETPDQDRQYFCIRAYALYFKSFWVFFCFVSYYVHSKKILIFYFEVLFS